MKATIVSVLLTAVLGILIFATPAFAAICLSDEELDGVCAEGLSFDFDVLLKDLTDLDSTLSNTLLNFASSGQGGGFILSSAGGGVNSVIVGDQSQQYLSSLVNINAAGSIVPVMLNITVNINSTVSGVSNTNNLDFSNFNTFNLSN